MTSALPYRPALARLHPYVPGEQPRGGNCIKLNTNENPYPPSEAAVAAMVSAARSGLQRYPDPLATSFRIEAAKVFGLPGPEWILCGNGSDEILTILVRAFVGEGELLRLPFPSYILYRTLAEIQGARWEQVAFNADWSLKAEFASTKSGLKLVLLPNPNSPSGTFVARDEIIRVANQLPCPLVVDEAYADFAESHCVDLVQSHENIIVTRTLSKSYALAGLRFGFCIAQPQVIASLSKIKDSYNCDAISIAGATAAIADQGWLETNRARVLRTRQWATEEFRELGFTVTESHANFIWCTRKDRPVQPLYAALKEQQVLVRYMNYDGWGDGLRVSIGTDDQMKACAHMLRELIATTPVST